MLEELSRQRQVVDLVIPQSDYAVVSEMMRMGHIVEQDYEENNIVLKVELPRQLVGKVVRYQVKES